MIATYAMKSIYANRRTMLPTLLVIAATTAAITTMLGLLEGLYVTVDHSGHADNAVVLSRGVDSNESASTLSIPAIERLKVMPGATQVSPELVASFPFRKLDGSLGSIVVRGVDPVAYTVHDEVRVNSGAAPARGVLGLVIGARQLGQYEDFVEGGKVRIGRHVWPVVGVLSAPGSFLESELWCDRTVLMEMLRTDHVSAAYVRLSGEAAQGAFAAEVAKERAEPMHALSERAYYRERLKQFALYMDTIFIVVVMLALGAVFAGTNAMYAGFLTRLRELATLMAIGYTRRRVAAMMLFESFALCLLGGLLGLLIGAETNGYAMSFPEFAVVYSLRISLRVLLAGAGVAAMMGVLSGMVVVVQTLRLQVLAALRD